VYAYDASSVMESEGWSQVKESHLLVLELLKFFMTSAVPDSNRTDNNKNNKVVVESLDVASLRARLLKANLDIDGNREILVERLKKHYSPHNYDNDTGRRPPRRRSQRQR
jgi:hypothetical protein